MYVACTALVYAHFDSIWDITIITVIAGAIKTLYLTSLVAQLALAQHIPHVGTCDQQYREYYYLIAIVERRYREISRVHCRVLLRVRSTSNNARGNERVMFPRYRRSTMVIRYLSYIKKYWSFKSSSNTKGP